MLFRTTLPTEAPRPEEQIARLLQVRGRPALARPRRLLNLAAFRCHVQAFCYNGTFNMQAGRSRRWVCSPNPLRTFGFVKPPENLFSSILPQTAFRGERYRPLLKSRHLAAVFTTVRMMKPRERQSTSSKLTDQELTCAIAYVLMP
jgi:hypothetical protein